MYTTHGNSLLRAKNFKELNSILVHNARSWESDLKSRFLLIRRMKSY